MKSLFEVIQEAEANRTAIGHFNISTVDALWGIFHAAKSLDVPVVIGVSEGERDFIGVKQVAALIHSIREEYSYPIYLNADHSYSIERVKEAVEAGFDSVIIDGAKLAMEENIALTKEAVKLVKTMDWRVLVEAEVGYIGSSSKMLDEVPDDVLQAAMPTGLDVKKFVDLTQVDLISPAVGNVHGMVKNAKNPELKIDLIREIREDGGVPLVLHGGSGISDDNFKEAIAAGISMIHINTEIRKAWREATATFLQDNPNEVAPYKILKSAKEAVEGVVLNRLKLYNGIA